MNPAPAGLATPRTARPRGRAIPRFDPAARHVLLSAERRRGLPPGPVLDCLPLRPDATVADIGCGPGFTLPLAERLPHGTVYPLDTEQAMLESVRERAATAGRANITTLPAAEDVLSLAPGGLDGAFLAFTILFIADRAGYLALLRDLVRPDGWLAILDWERRRNPGPGPPLESRVLPAETAVALVAAGWRIVARRTPGAWTYFCLANRAQ